MKIGGFVKASFVDYSGKIASVVFTQGCNLNCGYCHNGGLIGCNSNMKLIQSEDVLNWLSKRSGIIDAVVISGGEPTMQSNLHAFIRELKKRSLYVKLDTNGTNPTVLKSLIERKMVDFIAMDIKAPFNKYASVCGMEYMDLLPIKKSVDIIKNSGLNYEFRTTLCSELDGDDISQIISDFQISSNYIVQHCRSEESSESFGNKRNVNMIMQQLKQEIECSFRGFGIG